MSCSILKSITVLLSRFLTASFCICCLVACSKPTETQTVSWKLTIDGKSVLSKDAANDKVATLNLTFLELRLKIEGACNLGRLVREATPTNLSKGNTSGTIDTNSFMTSSSTMTKESAVNESKHASGSPQNVFNSKQSSTQSFAPLSLTPEVALVVNQKMASHLCSIQKEQNQGCADESRKTSKKMPADHLQLLAYVQNEFGMKGSAEIVFDQTYLSADKSKKRHLSETIKLNMKSLSCELVEESVIESKK